eukprot:427684_1
MQQLYQQLQNQQTVRQVTAPNQAVYYQQMQPQPIIGVNSQHIRQPQSIQYSIPQSQTLQTQVPSYIPQQTSYQTPQINTNTGVSVTPLVRNNGFLQGAFNSTSPITLPNNSSTPIYTLPAATTQIQMTQTPTFAAQNGGYTIISQPTISGQVATVAPSQAATNINPTTQSTSMINSTNTLVANNSCQKQQQIQFQQLQQQQQASQQQLVTLQLKLQQLAALQQQTAQQSQNQTQTQIAGGVINNNINETKNANANANISPQQLALLAQQHFEQQQQSVNSSGTIETHSNTTHSSQQNPPNKTHSPETNPNSEGSVFYHFASTNTIFSHYFGYGIMTFISNTESVLIIRYKYRRSYK